MWNVGEVFKLGKEPVIHPSLLMEGQAAKGLLFKRSPVQKCAQQLMVDGPVGHPGQLAQQTVCTSGEEVVLTPHHPMGVAIAKEKI